MYLDSADATCSSIYISPQVEQVLGYPVEAWYSDPAFLMMDITERIEAEQHVR